MRYLCLLALVLTLGIFVNEAGARERAKALALLQLAEQATDGHPELMKLKIERYNACVKALQSAEHLHHVGKLDLFELATVATELVDAALDIRSDAHKRIEVLEMHVEFEDNLHKIAVEGPPFGAGPSKYQIARTEARLLNAKVKLLEAKEKLQERK